MYTDGSGMDVAIIKEDTESFLYRQEFDQYGNVIEEEDPTQDLIGSVYYIGESNFKFTIDSWLLEEMEDQRMVAPTNIPLFIQMNGN